MPVLTFDELGRLADALRQPTVLGEAGVLLGCLSAAWALTRLLRGYAPRPGSIWFGDRIVDGVLFPALALALALMARWGLREILPLALFEVAVPVLVSLLVIRLVVRVLSRTYPDSSAMRIFERWISWLVWIGGVLWILGVLPRLMGELDLVHWNIGSISVPLGNLIEGLLSGAAVLVLALWVSAALETRLLAGATDNLSLRKMAVKTLRALLLFVGVLIAFSAAGIDLTALGVLGGALGVGIGLGLQKLAANYVSGFVILAERSVRIGDMVGVDGFEGYVTDISTRYTRLRALDGREAIVPNEMMVTQRVVNNTLADPKVAQSTSMRVAYDTDLQALMPRLAQAVAAVPRVLASPAPDVQLTSFGADGLGLELTVIFWITDANLIVDNARSDVNLAILRVLDAQEIKIPRA
ncbi:MAG TPA: mechanosensitive ion channel [Rubrivivax sp.]|nr:mechanosensitive ion channel [Burkholderiales bacterium]HNU12110.1 mechanosensitive ion channel [Rubrivivax sp.]